MKTHTLKLFLAFLIGATLATLITLYLTGDYTRRLEVDLEWAVQRGIRVEAMLILCRQGVGDSIPRPTPKSFDGR